jgi:hypothetical protein
VPVLCRKFRAEYLVRSSEEPASLYRFNFRWMQVLSRKLPLKTKEVFDSGAALVWFRDRRQGTDECLRNRLRER